ncbi:unnamed protein product [Blepharisma stoltei]|uniref:Uncharacterized protein n=1 Tax=Blepharisma stoltei TaxID=1481888 RepID=A0AAU9KB51_9CILI|nr:unnamed protein product [Blepharisma stoltei]
MSYFSHKNIVDDLISSKHSYLTHTINSTLQKSRRILEESKKLTLLHQQRNRLFGRHNSLWTEITDKIGEKASLYQTFDRTTEDSLFSKRGKCTPSILRNDRRALSTDITEAPGLEKTISMDSKSLKRMIDELKQENLNLKREMQYSKSIGEDHERLKSLYGSKSPIEEKLDYTPSLNSYNNPTTLEERYKDLEEKYLYEISINERLREEIRSLSKKGSIRGRISSQECLNKINQVEGKLRESFKDCEDLKEKIRICNKTSLKPKKKISKSSKALLSQSSNTKKVKTKGIVLHSNKNLKTIKRKVSKK